MVYRVPPFVLTASIGAVLLLISTARSVITARRRKICREKVPWRAFHLTCLFPGQIHKTIDEWRKIYDDGDESFAYWNAWIQFKERFEQAASDSGENARI